MCYSTVTCKVLLNWAHSKLGQCCAHSDRKDTEPLYQLLTIYQGVHIMYFMVNKAYRVKGKKYTNQSTLKLPNLILDSE